MFLWPEAFKDDPSGWLNYIRLLLPTSNKMFFEGHMTYLSKEHKRTLLGPAWDLLDRRSSCSHRDLGSMLPCCRAR